jgi:pSer/pThr/pTyr-binding forkhead associated (FHA) protein
VLVPGSPVLLQFLPSGMCITLALDRPTVLGRHSFAASPTPDRVVDLSHLGAEKHGVSRQHCLLRRQGAHLILTDLGSTNGTYLNGERISPHRPHRLSEGDRLILGTLHLVVFFGPARTQ